MRKIVLMILGSLIGCVSFAESVVAPASQPQYYIISPYIETAANKSEGVKESFGDVSADFVWDILNNITSITEQTNQQSIQLEISETKKQSMRMAQGQIIDQSLDDSEGTIQKSLLTAQKTTVKPVKRSHDKPIVVYEVLPSTVIVEQMPAVMSLDMQNLELNGQQDMQSPMSESEMQNIGNQKKAQATDDE